MSDKLSLRSEYRAKRSAHVAALSPSIMNLSFSTIASPLRAILENCSCMASYIPIGSEASPLKLTQSARTMGIKICLPHVTSKISPMQFIEWGQDDAGNDDNLFEGPMGLLQPSPKRPICAPDVILAPLIAFDRSLTRLGQGAGHYDRALSLMESSIFIGIAWSVQEAAELPADPWDQKMDAILTEREWIIS